MKLKNLTATLSLSLLAACGGGGGSSGSPPPPPPTLITETVTYNIADFTRVSINGSFDVTVRQGATYLVQVTIDANEVSKLDVVKNGDQLNVGFLPGSDVRADFMSAVIQMPDLQGIELRGSNFAQATGFGGGMLEISIDGNNVLNFADGTFDYVMASVLGSSLLELANIAPIPSAHLEISGSSTTTVNLLDFATVTGSLGGTSALHYYGNDIDFQMSIASSASVSRLGNSR